MICAGYVDLRGLNKVPWHFQLVRDSGAQSRECPGWVADGRGECEVVDSLCGCQALPMALPHIDIACYAKQ